MGRPWRVRAAVGVALAVAFYAALVVMADAPRLLDALRLAHGGLVLLAFAAKGVALVVRSARWRLYLARLDTSVPLAPGFAMGLAGGRGGQLVKAYDLQQTASVPYHVSLPGGPRAGTAGPPTRGASSTPTPS